MTIDISTGIAVCQTRADAEEAAAKYPLVRYKGQTFQATGGKKARTFSWESVKWTDLNELLVAIEDYQQSAPDL